MAQTSTMFTNKPLFIQANSGDTAISYDAVALRTLVGAIWQRTGIITDTAFTMTAGTGFTINIAPGIASIGDYTTFPSSYDRYLAYTTSTLTVPLTGFITNPSATRTHKVFITILDRQKAGTTGQGAEAMGSGYEARFVATEDVGNGAPNPTDPALANYMQLGTFTIAPSASGPTNVLRTIKHATFGQDHTTLTVNSGFADASSLGFNLSTPKAQRMGTLVFLSGAFARSGSANFTANTMYTVGNIPPSMRPRTDKFLVAPSSDSNQPPTYPNGGHATYRLQIRADTGDIQAEIPADYAPVWCGLDGVTYDIDV